MWISMGWIIWSTLKLFCIKVLIGKRDCMDLMKVIRMDDLMNDYDAMGVYTMQYMNEIPNALRLRFHPSSSFGLHVSAFAFSPAASRPDDHW
jgi:hypothetical protein